MSTTTAFIISHWELVVSTFLGTGLITTLAVLIVNSRSSHKDRKSTESIADREALMKFLTDKRDAINKLSQELSGAALYADKIKIERYRNLEQKFLESVLQETEIDIDKLYGVCIEVLDALNEGVEAMGDGMIQARHIIVKARFYLGDRLATKLIRTLTSVSIESWGLPEMIKRIRTEVVKAGENEYSIAEELTTKWQKDVEPAIGLLFERNKVLSNFFQSLQDSLVNKHSDVVEEILELQKKGKNPPVYKN
jgi:hypothetical protein